MTTDKSSEREAFEALAISEGVDCSKDEDGYILNSTQIAFDWFVAGRAALPQQAQEAPSDDLRELGKWLNEEPNRPIDRSALARVLAWAQVSAPQQAQEALELRAENERLRIRGEAYERAYGIAYRATYQSHNGHWDSTMRGGLGCRECIAAREARESCDAVLREGLQALADRAAIAKGERHE